MPSVHCRLCSQSSVWLRAQRSTELLAASDAAGKQQQSDLELLQRQLADMRVEHAAINTAEQAAGHERRVSDAWPTEHPAQRSATAETGDSRPARVGCAALLAVIMQPDSTLRAQDELPHLSDELIKADGGHRSSLVAAATAHSASQQPVAAAAVAQAVSIGVGGANSDDAAGKDASLLVVSQGLVGSQQPAQPQRVDHDVDLARDQSAVAACASLSAAGNGEITHVAGTKVPGVKPLVQEVMQGACTALPPAVARPDSRHASFEQRNKSPPPAATRSDVPTSDTSALGLKQLASDQQVIAAPRRRSMAVTCEGTAELEAAGQMSACSRGVADIFASLSYLQDGMASTPEPALLRSVGTRSPEGEPARKKRRAEVV